MSSVNSESNEELHRRTFNEQMSKAVSQKSKNCSIITEESAEAIKRTLLTGKGNDALRRRIKRNSVQIKDFETEKNVLCAANKVSGMVLKRVAIYEKFFDIIRQYHTEGNIHSYHKTTYHQIQQFYIYLPRYAVDIYISLCSTCQNKSNKNIRRSLNQLSCKKRNIKHLIKNNNTASMDYSIEEIKDHLKNPCYESKSLAHWSFHDKLKEKIIPILAEATQQSLKGEDLLKAMNYSEATLGDPDYLDAVSKFMSQFFNHNVSSSSLAATYGATHGFNVIVTEFFQESDYVFVEDLTYWGATGMSKQYGLNLISVSCDDVGMDIADLESKLEKCRKKHKRTLTPQRPFWGIIYAMTQLHNPKGISYTEERCKQLVDIARKFNVLVVTDDVYFPYRFSNDNQNKIGDVLVAYDQCNWKSGTGNVASNGSLSKILFPTIRLGWVYSSPWLINRIGKRADAMSGGQFNTYNQRLATKMLNNKKFMEVFQSVQNLCEKQMTLACDYLENNLPKEITFKRPEGSFFLWVKLPDGYDAKVLLQKCKEYHVRFNPGELYTMEQDGTSYVNYLRLSITNLAEKELMMSLNVFCEQCRIYLGQS